MATALMRFVGLATATFVGIRSLDGYREVGKDSTKVVSMAN
jgi:hypothetical protein